MSDMEYTRKYTVDMTSHISLAPAVVSYADRMHAVLGSGQQVASPLAAWLLLALAAHGSRGPERAVLAETLGMDVDDAAVAAGELLCAPHPAVAAAVAIWHRAKFAAPALTTWQRELPERVGRGPVPDQAGADEWARRSTLDLIKRFPLHMKDNTALVLASALATRVSWVRPFMLVPAAELGSSEWASRLDRVLRTPESGHTAFIARTSRAGTVAAHTALSREGLSVTSVVADVSVPAADALAAAASVVALRGEEAEGRLDHLLAGPVGRKGWLVARAAATAVLVARLRDPRRSGRVGRRRGAGGRHGRRAGAAGGDQRAAARAAYEEALKATTDGSDTGNLQRKLDELADVVNS